MLRHRAGQPFIDLIIGISVGSEDLYRVTPTGIANKAGIGSSPDDLVKYIQQTRDKLDGHDDLKRKIGHVDTWTAWINETNYPVTDAVNWIGMDGELNLRLLHVKYADRLIYVRLPLLRNSKRQHHR